MSAGSFDVAELADSVLINVCSRRSQQRINGTSRGGQRPTAAGMYVSIVVGLMEAELVGLQKTLHVGERQKRVIAASLLRPVT